MDEKDFYYMAGQAELIKHIQKELEKALNKAEGVDLALDVISILKSLRPLPRPEDE
jgi:hypothetical protein